MHIIGHGSVLSCSPPASTWMLQRRAGVCVRSCASWGTEEGAG